jgi:hypothetical protein
MQSTFEEIRDEIHKIRNLLGPIDLKLDNLDHKITASRISFESKTSELEAKIGANTLKISEQGLRISTNSDDLAQQSERIKRIELFLKIPQTAEKQVPAPVHEDKTIPVIPPSAPPA